MHPIEIEESLKTLTLLVDSREHPGQKLTKRVEQTGLPSKTVKLDFGDYSGEFYKGNEKVTLEDIVVIERKMDGNELAMCLGRERQRFEREFQRAQSKGAIVYLLVENENFEKLYAGRYGAGRKFRSKLSPISMMGSLFAWACRYDIRLILCKEETTGQIIHDILYYQARELLNNE